MSQQAILEALRLARKNIVLEVIPRQYSSNESILTVYAEGVTQVAESPNGVVVLEAWTIGDKDLSINMSDRRVKTFLLHLADRNGKDEDDLQGVRWSFNLGDD